MLLPRYHFPYLHVIQSVPDAFGMGLPSLVNPSENNAVDIPSVVSFKASRAAKEN